MSESQSMKCNAYLLRVLQKRSAELEAAYRHIVHLGREAHNRRTSYAFVQTHLETDDAAIQTPHSLSTDCDECCTLKETVQETKRQLDDCIQSVSDRDCELAELKSKLRDSTNSIAELQAQVETGSVAWKGKEAEVEELEGLIMLCKSETLAAEIAAENSRRETESLKSELTAVKASLQTKDDVLAENMLEKDDLEEMNARLEASNASLSRQLDELQLQLQDQKSQFEAEIRRQKQQLTDEEKQSVNSELIAQCKQAALAPLDCSQPGDFLASQQSGELPTIRLELLTLQAEKEDLIQQLHQCRTELLCSRHSNESECRAAQSSATSAATKPLTSSLGELESQNAALLGQLLVVEDQLAEYEMQLQNSHEGRQQSAEQLQTTLKELADSSARVASLEREKLQLETELNAAKMSLETSGARLQECESYLSLAEGKLSAAGNRQRQLMSQKQTLETQNRELSRRLQLVTSKQPNDTISLPSQSSMAVSDRQHVASIIEAKENQVLPASKLASTCQQSGCQQLR